jgi:phosphoribosylformimino-5-aminoimidazole carboxamide ribotide isomerase
MTFEVIPSVDVLDGEVVRLIRGDFATKTVYSHDPLATAKDWEARGATRLHVVDLEAALTGEPLQHEVIESIVTGAAVPVQVAGGIRTIESALHWIDAGADRVVLGTSALTDEAFLRDAIAALGPRLVVAPDSRDGQVYVSGWTKPTGESVVDAAKRLADAGVARLLVTDISTDGMLEGPNVELLSRVAATANIPVIASGGVANVDDLRALRAVPGIEGVIVGKALYDGALKLSEALSA